MSVQNKRDRRFFDPRPPGHKRQNAATLCHNFNVRFPVGTAIRVYPMARWLNDCWRDTEVAAPGAFINSAGYAVVKIPGDCIALTHVQVGTQMDGRHQQAPTKNGDGLGQQG